MSNDCSLANNSNHPIAVIVLGMAGSGKTTLTSKLVSCLEKSQRNCFSVNLDPAVHEIGYFANIDIRDTINYDDLKREYSLGPNGAIVTSLNLFATKFHQVMDIIAKKTSAKYVMFDTPGQIEVFTWSASGTIISETLASSMPTVILYVMDTTRSDDVSSFMRNMLYACSVSINYNMPFIAVFNKTDILDSTKLKNWMSDFELFSKEFEKEGVPRVDYSLFLHLEEFYCNLKTVSVSSTTGQGFEDLAKAIDDAKEEYNKEFKPIYEQMQSQSAKKVAAMFERLDKLGINKASGADIRDNCRQPAKF